MGIPPTSLFEFSCRVVNPVTSLNDEDIVPAKFLEDNDSSLTYPLVPPPLQVSPVQGVAVDNDPVPHGAFVAVTGREVQEQPQPVI